MPTKSKMRDLYTPLPLIPIYSILVGSSYFRMCVLPYWVISSTQPRIPQCLTQIRVQHKQMC